MHIDQNPSLEDLMEFEKVSWPTDLQADEATLQKRLDDFGIGVFVLEVADEIVCQITVAPKNIPHEIKGFTQMRDLSVDKESKDLWVINIATRMDRRGKGYAKKLMKFVIHRGGLAGFDTIQTGVTCHGLKESGLSVGEYMKRGLNPALNLFGDVEWELVENYWPDDKGSLGYGVILKLKL